MRQHAAHKPTLPSRTHHPFLHRLPIHILLRILNILLIPRRRLAVPTNTEYSRLILPVLGGTVLGVVP